MNAMPPLVFQKGRFVFREKSHHFHISAQSFHKLCDARIIFRTITIEGCFADRKLLIETMIEQIGKVVLKTIKSVYQHDSNNHQNIDIFRISVFRSEEPNTMESQQQLTTRKTSNENLIEGMKQVALEKFEFEFREKSIMYELVGSTQPLKF